MITKLLVAERPSPCQIRASPVTLARAQHPLPPPAGRRTAVRSRPASSPSTSPSSSLSTSNFWRVFSRKRVASSSGASARGGDDSDASSSASAPTSPRRTQGRGEHDRVVTSLPTFVHSGSGAPGEKAAECAVCIAELRDGDEGRAPPRCGHRFHAACVDVWLRLHTTCPLCRASVVVPAPEAEPKGGVPDTRAAVEDMDAPV